MKKSKSSNRPNINQIKLKPNLQLQIRQTIRRQIERVEYQKPYIMMVTNLYKSLNSLHQFQGIPFIKTNHCEGESNEVTGHCVII